MQIDIDCEVFKSLSALRENESDTYNDVVRRLLKLDPVQPPESPPAGEAPTGYMAGGRHLPNGTQLQATYKGKEYSAEVVSGRIVSRGGKPFNSLSAAAKDITGNNVNGLRFWKARRPSDTQWVMVAGFPVQRI
jgi:hypothetical protein